MVTLNDADTGEGVPFGVVHERCWAAFAAAHDIEPD
jgi:hypothetical protein